MPRNSLPPGFRFHPTDVELVLYYLKRKIMGKKLHYEAIDEVNIYKFSPWDLPDKSCLKSKDLEWFFFCPREKKYASGTRVKRATENGYWKTTGKDRNIHYNDRTVGAVKTLVFHLGHAPQGERTDWVIHEYKILDDKLAAEGIQDTYVLCKVFKKNGPGPKNGAQYGAPFNEADWADDEVADAENHGTPLASGSPSLTTLAQTEKQIFPLEKGLFAPGSTSGLPVLEGPLPSAGGLTFAVDADVTDDEIQHLLAPFTVEDMLLSNENRANQDDPSDKGMNELVPFSDGHDIYTGLGNLDTWRQMNESMFGFSGLHNDKYFANNMLLEDGSTYIELSDLLSPLDCPNEIACADQSALGAILGVSDHEYTQQLYSGAIFSDVGPYAPRVNELPMPPHESHEIDNGLGVVQMVDHHIYQGSNASQGSGFATGLHESFSYPTDNMGRGWQILVGCYSRIMECDPGHRLPTAAAPSYSVVRGGSSTHHIKAEVTHRAGECTNEALSLMMGLLLCASTFFIFMFLVCQYINPYCNIYSSAPQKKKYVS